MNANQIHIGEEYAAIPNKPNGNAIILGAKRIKVMRIFGQVEYGNKRDTMYVEGFPLDREDGTVLRTDYVKYRARDVIEEWDDYYDRVQQYEVEQKKREAERAERRRLDNERWDREREERRLRVQAEDRERLAKQQAIAIQRDKIKEALAERGLSQVAMDSVNESVVISFDEIKKWLGIADEPNGRVEL